MYATVLPIYLMLYLQISPLAFGVIDGLYQGGASLVRLGGGLALAAVVLRRVEEARQGV